jgi:hypothetical protein
MLMKPREGAGSGQGPLSRPPSGRGQGFFNAPWWRLLLWIVVFAVVLFVAGEVGIV